MNTYSAPMHPDHWSNLTIFALAVVFLLLLLLYKFVIVISTKMASMCLFSILHRKCHHDSHLQSKLREKVFDLSSAGGWGGVLSGPHILEAHCIFNEYKLTSLWVTFTSYVHLLVGSARHLCNDKNWIIWICRLSTCLTLLAKAHFYLTFTLLHSYIII